MDINHYILFYGNTKYRPMSDNPSIIEFILYGILILMTLVFVLDVQYNIIDKIKNIIKK